MEHLIKQKTRSSKYISQNGLDKVCFQHEMAYGNFKDWSTIKFIIFRDFWWLSKFFFHPNWNEVWLLVINWYIPAASQVAERSKT